MKFMLITLFTLASPLAFASTTPEANRAKLSFLQQNRTATVWNCTTAGENEAVVMFRVNEIGAARVSSSVVIAVQDQQICDALRVVCPYVGATTESHGWGGPRFSYWSTNGKYEDGVEFFSEGPGMKITHSNNHGLNWYFNPGECQLQ